MAIATKKHWGKVTKLSSTTKRKPVAFDIYRLYTKDDGTFPNNEDYPTIIYKSAFHGTESDGRKQIIASNKCKWTSPWLWGIFTYHHYHTKAWELLLCVGGSATIQIGGSLGPATSISQGDLILIPPGVAHKQLDEKNDFALLGSYPSGGKFDASIDTLRGKPSTEDRERIKMSHVPECDPIFNLDVHELFNAPCDDSDE